MTSDETFARHPSHRPTSWDEYFSEEDSDRESLDATEPESCPLCGNGLFPFFDGSADRCSWCGATVERLLGEDEA